LKYYLKLTLSFLDFLENINFLQPVGLIFKLKQKSTRNRVLMRQRSVLIARRIVDSLEKIIDFEIKILVLQSE